MGTPVRPPAADRTKPAGGDIFVVLAVLLAAGVLFFLLLPRGGNFLTAQIVLDGELVAEYRLDRLEESVVLPLEDAAWPITLEITPEGVRVLESSCPGQDCVHSGVIRRAGGRIICLPNRLVVSLAGDGGSVDDIDAVTG